MWFKKSCRSVNASTLKPNDDYLKEPNLSKKKKQVRVLTAKQQSIGLSNKTMEKNI